MAVQGVEVGVPRRRLPPRLRLRLASRLLDQDAAHRLGGRGEEMAAPVPARGRTRPDEPEVGLVNQGRRLQRLAGPLVRQPLGGQPAQFVVDQRQELGGRIRVTPLDGREDVHDIVHGKAARNTACSSRWARPRSLGPRRHLPRRCVCSA